MDKRQLSQQQQQRRVEAPTTGTFSCECVNTQENKDAVITTQPSQYKKIRTLRETLFGKVRLCVDTKTNQRVAVKLSKKEMVHKKTTTGGKQVAENPLAELDFLRRIERGPDGHVTSSCLVSAVSTVAQRAIYAETHKFKASQLVGSKYVLHLLGQCEDTEFFYTILEFCEKGEFFDILIKQSKFSDDMAAKYFAQMLYGVAYMHACGICHLDLSLENCLMDEDDNLKICDFGVARFLPYTRDKSNVHALVKKSDEYPEFNPHNLPHAYEVSYPGSSRNKPGKLGYMAPEIFSGRPFFGTQADVWSMGVILFVMLLGVPPFQLPTTSDQRFNLIYKGDTYRLLQAWKLHNTVSKDAIDLLNQMMAPAEKRITIPEIMQHPWLQNRW